MLNYIWLGLIIISIVCGLATGRIEEVSSAVLTGGEKGVELVVQMMGMMCFWTGLMQIAQKGGLTKIISKILSPLLKLLFPKLPKDSKASQAISMNLASNFLGLGNAATPFGLTAMKELKKIDNCSNTASNSMIMFVVLNTASIQLIPTTLIILRTKYNSAQPTDVLPAIWITSICSLIIGLIVCKIIEMRGKRHG